MTTERQLVIKQVLAFPPGGFAGVFLAPAERKVFKLFKNYKHPDVCPERGVIEDELRRLVFEAEMRAYKIASADEELKKFIPVFYGSPKVSRVVALDGQDITNQYLLDCCLHSSNWGVNVSNLKTCATSLAMWKRCSIEREFDIPRICPLSWTPTETESN